MELLFFNCNFIDYVKIFCASGVLSKPRIVAITKCDLGPEMDMKRTRRTLPCGLPIVFISSVSGMGVNKLMDELWKLINA